MSELRMIEVLNYYDGVLEFIASRSPGEPRVASDGATFTPPVECIYGLLAEGSSIGADEARTYDCWSLPPRSVEPEFQVTEDELHREDP